MVREMSRAKRYMAATMLQGVRKRTAGWLLYYHGEIERDKEQLVGV